MAARTVVSAIPARSSEENAGHVLSVAFPVHAGYQTSNPTPSASSQHSHPSTISGTQPTTAVTVPLFSSGSGSVPRAGAQENAHTDRASASIAQDQTNRCSSTQSISNTVGQQLVTEDKHTSNLVSLMLIVSMLINNIFADSFLSCYSRFFVKKHL